MMTAHFLDGFKEGESEVFPKTVNTLQYNRLDIDEMKTGSLYDPIQYHLLFLYEVNDSRHTVGFFSTKKTPLEQNKLQFEIFNSWMQALRKEQMEEALNNNRFG